MSIERNCRKEEGHDSMGGAKVDEFLDRFWRKCLWTVEVEEAEQNIQNGDEEEAKLWEKLWGD